MVVSRQSENDYHGGATAIASTVMERARRSYRVGTAEWYRAMEHEDRTSLAGGASSESDTVYRRPMSQPTKPTPSAEIVSCSPVAQIHTSELFPGRRIRSCGRRVTTGHKGDGGRSQFSRFLAAASTHRHAFRLTPSRRLKCDPHRISAHDKPPMLHNEIDHAAIHTQGCTCRG
jgi:hypothetical protein